MYHCLWNLYLSHRKKMLPIYQYIIISTSFQEYQPGGHFNIKMLSYQNKNSIIKIWLSHGCLIVTMIIFIPWNTVSILNQPQEGHFSFYVYIFMGIHYGYTAISDSCHTKTIGHIWTKHVIADHRASYFSSPTIHVPWKVTFILSWPLDTCLFMAIHHSHSW